MWVSIVAWVVVVASWFLRLFTIFHCGRFVIVADLGPDAILNGYAFWDSPVKRIEVVKLFLEWCPPYWPEPHLTARCWSHDFTIVSVGMPTWYLAIPPTAVFFILHRRSLRDRRLAHRLKHAFCPRCGYSRAGIADGAKCPECGEGSAAASKTSPAPPK